MIGEPMGAIAEERSGRTRALVGALAVSGLTTLVGLVLWPVAEPTEADVTVAPIAVAVVPPPTAPDPFASITLEAHAAIVYDLTTGTPLYTLDERRALPLASLTKLMTALVAYEATPAGASVEVTPYALSTEGDSGLIQDEVWSLADLIGYTLLTSSNDGAGTLASAAGALLAPEKGGAEGVYVDTFVSSMNKRAHSLGMRDTVFLNATGLDEGAESGAQGSARDVALLLGHLLQHTPDLLDDTTRVEKRFTSKSGIVHTAKNTNEFVGDISGLRGSKTGYTDLAGGNLGVVYDTGLNQPFAVVVLGSSLEGRFRDVHKLIEATNTYMTSGWYEHTAGTTPIHK